MFLTYPNTGSCWGYALPFLFSRILFVCEIEVEVEILLLNLFFLSSVIFFWVYVYHFAKYVFIFLTSFALCESGFMLSSRA